MDRFPKVIVFVQPHPEAGKGNDGQYSETNVLLPLEEDAVASHEFAQVWLVFVIEVSPGNRVVSQHGVESGQLQLLVKL